MTITENQGNALKDILDRMDASEKERQAVALVIQKWNTPAFARAILEGTLKERRSASNVLVGFGHPNEKEANEWSRRNGGGVGENTLITCVVPTWGPSFPKEPFDDEQSRLIARANLVDLDALRDPNLFFMDRFLLVPLERGVPEWDRAYPVPSALDLVGEILREYRECQKREKKRPPNLAAALVGAGDCICGECERNPELPEDSINWASAFTARLMSRRRDPDEVKRLNAPPVLQMPPQHYLPQFLSGLCQAHEAMEALELAVEADREKVWQPLMSCIVSLSRRLEAESAIRASMPAFSEDAEQDAVIRSFTKEIRERMRPVAAKHGWPAVVEVLKALGKAEEGQKAEGTVEFWVLTPVLSWGVLCPAPGELCPLQVDPEQVSERLEDMV